MNQLSPSNPNTRIKSILLIVAILLPILYLGWQAARLALVRSTAYKIQLPIQGYDPRDLLAGHYITYRLDLPTKATCQDFREYNPDTETACLCIRDNNLRPKNMRLINCESEQLIQCKTYIKGRCQYSRFEAGIEKYFIPESDASRMDKQIRAKGAWIELAIEQNGRAQVVDLLWH